MFSIPDEQRVAHWGVDIGYRRVSVAALVPGRFKVRSAEVEEGLPMVQTLRELHEATFEIARELQSYGQARSIVVEQPGGKFVEPRLWYACAVICLALDDFGYVDTLPPASWKKQAIGNGHAKKADIMAWARGLGYTGTGKAAQDEADALGIARAAEIETKVMDETPIPADPETLATLPF